MKSHYIIFLVFYSTTLISNYMYSQIDEPKIVIESVEIANQLDFIIKINTFRNDNMIIIKSALVFFDINNVNIDISSFFNNLDSIKKHGNHEFRMNSIRLCDYLKDETKSASLSIIFTLPPDMKRYSNKFDIIEIIKKIKPSCPEKTPKTENPDPNVNETRPNPSCIINKISNYYRDTSLKSSSNQTAGAGQIILKDDSIVLTKIANHITENVNFFDLDIGLGLGCLSLHNKLQCYFLSPTLIYETKKSTSKMIRLKGSASALGKDFTKNNGGIMGIKLNAGLQFRLWNWNDWFWNSHFYDLKCDSNYWRNYVEAFVDFGFLYSKYETIDGSTSNLREYGNIRYGLLFSPNISKKCCYLKTVELSVFIIKKNIEKTDNLSFKKNAHYAGFDLSLYPDIVIPLCLKVECIPGYSSTNVFLLFNYNL